MMVSKHFNVKEFRCNNLVKAPAPYIPEFLLVVLESVREHFNRPVTINSAYREEEYNKAIGGAEDSAHLYDDPYLLIAAADIVVLGVPSSEVYEYLDSTYGDKISLGKYTSKGFTHVDTRSKHTNDRSRRWGS